MPGVFRIATILGFVFAILQTLTLSACRKPAPVDSEFVNLYAELRIATAEHGPATPNARMARQNVLREFGWTVERFAQETRRIQQTPALWQDFQNRVTAELDSLTRRNSAAIVGPVPAAEKPPAQPNPGDSASPRRSSILKKPLVPRSPKPAPVRKTPKREPADEGTSGETP